MTEGPIRRLESRDGLYGSVVTRYADARAALADPRLSKDPRQAPQDWQKAGRGRPLEDRSGLGTHLLTTDPPEHTRLRRLVSTAFSARRVEAMRDRIQQITDTLIEGFASGPRSELDLISEFAFPLPVTVICELLGVPAEDHLAFRQWTSDVVSSGKGREDARPAAMRSLHTYVTALLDTRRRDPAAWCRAVR
jgi:cytochrome P450